MEGKQQAIVMLESGDSAKTSRRAFLRHCGAAALVVGGVVGARPANAAPMVSGSEAVHDTTRLTRTSGVENFHYATFVPLLNSRFRLQHETGTATLELTGARESRHNDLARGMEQFTLTFHGAGQLLPDGIYQFSHRQLGDFLLFIMPTGHDKQGHYYRAVFNRRLRAAR